MSPKTKTATGQGAAAMIAGGIGTLAIGVFTTGAVISEALKNSLNLYNPVGPLSGKTTFGVVVWLIGWVILGSLWKDKDYDLNRAFTITMILLGIGLLLTFPPIFEAFE